MLTPPNDQKVCKFSDIESGRVNVIYFKIQSWFLMCYSVSYFRPPTHLLFFHDLHHTDTLGWAGERQPRVLRGPFDGRFSGCCTRSWGTQGPDQAASESSGCSSLLLWFSSIKKEKKINLRRVRKMEKVWGQNKSKGRHREKSENIHQRPWGTQHRTVTKWLGNSYPRGPGFAGRAPSGVW